MTAAAIPSGGGQASSAQAARPAGGRQGGGRAEGRAEGGRAEGGRRGGRVEGGRVEGGRVEVGQADGAESSQRGQRTRGGRRSGGGERSRESVASRVDQGLEQSGVSTETRAAVVEQLKSSVSEFRSSGTRPSTQQLNDAVQTALKDNGLSASHLPSGVFLDENA